MASSFIPSANEFTVHTARNRETLRSQLRAKTETNQRKAPLLNLKPVLGHVSMLTDVKSVSITSEKDSGQHQKTYIITADRDEHIRVSRGPPQSYIIETFCQGHTQFISRLCVPSWDSHILFSGGGESCVFVWDWLHGKVIQKANVHQHLPEIQATSINDSASSDISRVQLHSPHTIQPQKDESQEPVSFILAVPAFSSPSSPSSSFPTAADEPADIHQVVIGFEGYVIFVIMLSLC
jgi:WD40 repeat protein